MKIKVLGAVAMLLSGCGSYQALEQGEPHGYQSSHTDDGMLQVSFTTWRGWSDAKLCGQASRRARELYSEAVLQGPVIEDVSTDFTHVDSVHATVPEARDFGTQGDVSVMLAPDYVMFRRVRSCTWTVPVTLVEVPEDASAPRD